jgi:hypothetical protein
MSTRILGLAKPYAWVQPDGTDEILTRLRDCYEFAVHERERENMCSVAHGEIERLRESNAELLSALVNLALEARHYHNTGGGGSHLADSIERANVVITKATQP